MNLIELGKKEGLITFDEKEKYITYIGQSARPRNYSNPEEKVQAEAYLKLVLNYGYPKEYISLFQTVKMASSSKEADIVVYKDKEHTQPHIVVECKHKDVSKQEFDQAIEQAASYAYALAGSIQYIWIISSIEKSFKIDKDSSVKQTIPDIPRYGKTTIQKYKYAKGGKVSTDVILDTETKKNFFDIETIEQSELTKRFKQAHNALWAGGELNPSSAFDELDKLIFCKIWDERKLRKDGKPYDFQIFSEPIPKDATDKDKKKIEDKITNELFKRVNALYAEGQEKDPEVFKDDIRLEAPKVKTVVSYLEDINLSETDLDSKGRALADFLPTVTITAKNLATEITNHNVKQNNLQGQNSITNEHITNNKNVRKLLDDSGIKPEELPASKDLKKLERAVKSNEKKMIKQSQFPKKLKGVDDE